VIALHETTLRFSDSAHRASATHPVVGFNAVEGAGSEALAIVPCVAAVGWLDTVVRPAERVERDAHRLPTVAAARHGRAIRHGQTRTPAAFDDAR
jgi:hypothetical protein